MSQSVFTKWLRRLGWALLVLVALGIIFHRPIFFEGTRYFIVRAAQQQNLDIEYEMDGSIFTTLRVKNLVATPQEEGPVRRLEIELLKLRYSLWDLMRDGLPAFLKELELHNAYIDIAPEQDLPPEKEQQPQQFKFPALFPEKLIISNLNVIIRNNDKITQVEDFDLTLLPESRGELRVEHLNIPGLLEWNNVSASTSYEDRRLELYSLQVSQGIAINKLVLDMSKLSEQQLGIKFDGDLFEGSVLAEIQIKDLNASNQMEARVEASKIDYAPLANMFNLPKEFAGRLDNLRLDFSGTPTQPQTWTIDLFSSVQQIKFQQLSIAGFTLDVETKQGAGTLNATTTADVQPRLQVQSKFVLPKELNNFHKLQSDTQFFIADAQLDHFTAFKGAVNAEATIATEDGTATGTAQIDSSSIQGDQWALTDSSATVDFTFPLKTLEQASILSSSSGSVQSRISTLNYQGYGADDIILQANLADKLLTVKTLEFSRGSNKAQISGTYRLPDESEKWSSQPYNLKFDISASDLSQFAESQVSLQGVLNASGTVSQTKNIRDGQATISGKNIFIRDIPIRSISLNAELDDDRIHVEPLDIVFDDANKLSGKLTAQRTENFIYSAEVTARLRDLSIFDPLLGNVETSEGLGGSLLLFYDGKGDLNAGEHTGFANLDLEDARYKNLSNINLHLSADFSPQYINIPDFYLSLPQAQLMTSLFWKNDVLQGINMVLQQKSQELVTGSFTVPFHLQHISNLQQLIPPDGQLSADLRTRNLPLELVFEMLQLPPAPLAGSLNLDISAKGSINNPDIVLRAEADGLVSSQMPDLAPASLTSTLNVNGSRVTLDGTVQQSSLGSGTLSATTSLDLQQLVYSKSIDQNAAVSGRANFPSIQLAVLSKLTTAVRQSNGTASLQVQVDGTLSQPTINGSIAANMDALRMANPKIPVVSGLTLNAAFRENQLSIPTFTATVGGGQISLTGTVGLEQISNPLLDLQLESNNVLVLQNDDLTVRINTDLAAEGPWEAASVTGSIALTRSRFFRTIDILPIGLPGRPAPKPPSSPGRVSFPELFHDWTFDVSITTADPFIIDSNMAEGRITADLKLGGSGKEPWLDGTAFIEELETSLPFSTLKIESGQVFFNRQDPFVPRLNIQGTSTIRQYDVQVNIRGTTRDPEATFNSNPPLPQSEIVSLLATGMTTTELSEDPNALAGRAAFLLGKKLYHKLFGNDTPLDNDSFLGRAELDVGVTDPITGREATSLRIPVSDHIVLIGGVDVAGHYRGQVKYLIRFR